jgi:hypothetical protein
MTTPALAQRGGRGFSPSNGRLPPGSLGSGVRAGSVGHHGLPNANGPRSGFFSVPPFVSHRFHFRRDGFGPILLPYYLPYEEPFVYEQPYAEAVTNAPVAPILYQQPSQAQSQARRELPIGPQIIEVQGVAASSTSKVPLPAIFILKSGKQLESRRFMLTASKLSVSIDRQQQSIPVEMLDIDATVRANRDRGIELLIPADRNEISLSF